MLREEGRYKKDKVINVLPFRFTTKPSFFFFLFGLKKKGMKTFLGLKETTWCGREEINHWGGWAAGHTECIGQV
jgi:hypothetical protein